MTRWAAAAVATVTRLRTAPAEPQFSREQPFAAEVLANQAITGRGATKEVRHLEVNLAGSGLTYAPGDALGVWHENPPVVVHDVLQALRLDGEQSVEIDGAAKPLRDWLATTRELTRLTRPFLAQQAERSQDAALAEVCSRVTRPPLRHTSRTCRSSTCCSAIPATGTRRPSCRPCAHWRRDCTRSRRAWKRSAKRRT